MPKLSRKEFYDKYYPLAVKYTKGTNIHPETLMAQMALESSWGATANKDNGFAMFGIKGAGRNNTIDLKTTEENKSGGQYKSTENFRAYGSVDESMQDYVKLMQTDRYKNAFKTSDPEQQLKAIQDSGYAGKKYADTTTAILKQNKNYVPMGKENKETDGLSKIDTLPEFKTKLSVYKEKAKDGKLSPSEFQEFQMLQLKAKSILPAEQYAVFADDAVRNVMKPHMYGDVLAGESKYVSDINKIDSKINEATNPDEIIALNEQKAMVEKNFQSQKAKAVKFNTGFEAYEKNVPKDFKGYTGVGVGVLDDKIISENKKITDFADGVMNEYLGHKSEQGKLGDTESQEYFKGPIGESALKTISSGAGAGFGSFGSSTESLQKTTTSVAPPKTGGEINIHDITNAGPEGSPFAVGNKTSPYDLTADKKRLEDLKNLKQTEGVYEPDLKSSTDIGGYLMDIGRVGLGIKGAMEKLPDYQPSAMFSEAMDDATQRQDVGLSADEIGLAKNMAERGFGYDVKNIRNLSGGSAGVALGNLGRANTQLYDAYGNIAAADQQAKRANRQQFYNAADKAEAVNQYGFGIDYNEAMMNKQAGAGLVSDALKNMADRSQYEKTYGKGSQYYDYLKEQTLRMRDERQSLKNADEQRRLESIGFLEGDIKAKEDANAKLTNSYTNLDDAKNVVPSDQLSVNTGMLTGSGVVNTATGALPANKEEEKLINEGFTNVTTEKQGPPVINVLKDKEGRTIVTETGAGIEAEITGGQKEMVMNTAQGLNPQELKAMEAKGEKIYGLLLDTPEYKKKKSEILSKKLPKDKENELLDALDKEQQAWADLQFDKNNNYIGK